MRSSRGNKPVFPRNNKYPGMSVRTYAAIQIMAGFGKENFKPDYLAKEAVEQAEALLAELDKRQQEEESEEQTQED